MTTALSAITLLHSEARAFGFLIFSMFAGVACIPLIFDRLWQLARRADERALSMTFRVIAWLLPACILLSGNMLPEIWVRALPGDVGPYLRVGALISVRVTLILSLFSMGRLYQAIPRQ